MKAAVEDHNKFPFVLLGNKIDIDNKRVVSKKRAQKYCEEQPNMQYFETSAKENIGVVEVVSVVCL